MKLTAFGRLETGRPQSGMAVVNLKRFLTKLDLSMLMAMDSVKMRLVRNSFLTSLPCQVEKQLNQSLTGISKTGKMLVSKFN